MASQIETYRGHTIEVRARAAGPANNHVTSPSAAATAQDLVIDGSPVPYGQLPDGKYYLHDYAYDWRDDLVDLAKAYVDNQITQSKLRK